MTPVIHFCFNCFILVCAKLFGEVFGRLRLSAVVGEILAGVVGQIVALVGLQMKYRQRSGVFLGHLHDSSHPDRAAGPEGCRFAMKSRQNAAALGEPQEESAV